MTPIELFVVILGLLFGFGGAAFLIRFYDLRRPNFRGQRIPAVGGLAFVLCAAFIYAYEWLSQGLWVGSAAAYFLVTVGFGLLGLNDDLYGDRSTGGFKGHFKALRRGKLTTGAAKALGGGVISLVAGGLIAYPIGWQIVLAALLIALTANALNLLDLRPGRCLFGFFLGAASVISTITALHALPVGFLLYVAVGVALILYPFDATGRLMLGDVGANTFGAVLGVAMALVFSPFCQIIVVALLLFFHLWSETHSVSKTIEKNTVLRGLDRKIGVR